MTKIKITKNFEENEGKPKAEDLQNGIIIKVITGTIEILLKLKGNRYLYIDDDMFNFELMNESCVYSEKIENRNFEIVGTLDEIIIGKF